jgi:hypothetical protein
MLYGFKELMVLPVEEGEDEFIKYRRMKHRKTDTTSESVEVDEALNPAQRRQRARLFKRYKSRIEIGRERAKRKVASPEKLMNRSMKAARKAIIKKITKGLTKDELNFARRQEIEKRLETPAMKKRIKALAKRMLPKVRKTELERKRGGSSND